jgi:hypothetical protein
MAAERIRGIRADERSGGCPAPEPDTRRSVESDRLQVTVMEKRESR